MRWIVLLGLLASRVVAAAGNPTIDAADVSFGQVTAGQSAVRYIDIANTDTPPKATLVVTAASFVDNGAGWFSFAGNGCSGMASCTLSPALSITITAGLFAVRCAPPAGASGTQIAYVTFTSNTVVATHATSTLTCTAGEGQLAVVPPAVDFGPVDLDRVPLAVQSVIELRNTGNAPLAIGTAVLFGPDAARFAFGPLVPQPIAPGGHLDVTITYTPTQERTAADPDVAALRVPVTGTADGLPVDIALRGHGADRHAELGAVPVFADAFVNPGPTAQVLPLYVGDSGDEVLALTHAAITGSPVWSIDNPDPVDMPAHSIYPFLIRFAPQTVGPATPGTFSVTTSDGAHPTLTAVVTGNGKARDVAIAAPVDLHYAGIGTIVRLSDGTRGNLLAVENHDLEHAFAIRSIVVLGGEDAFEVVGATGVDLPPGTTRGFDVTFAPAHEGTYEATAYLYVDSDPVPQSSAVVRGEGVFVEVRGGGCATASGAGTGMIVVIALALARRRRCALAVLLVSATAHADTRNLDLAIFDPTPTTTPQGFQLQGAEVGHEGDWAASALLTYANDPLVLSTAPNDNIAIQDRMTFELGGAFAFGDRFETGARMPMYLQSGQNLNSPTMFGEPTAAATVRGDLTVHAKARILRATSSAGQLVVGTSIALGLPTASDEQFAGSGKPQMRLLGLVAFTPAALARRLAAYVNAGAVLRATAEWHDVSQASGLAWGVGATFRARADLAIAGEVFGELVPGGVRDAMGATRALDTTEALVGLRYQMERRVNVGVAVGRGLSSGIGAPALRAVLAVTFTPTAPPQTATKRVVGDIDLDGIPDDVDQCRNISEDKDGFEDEDGCPDPDNDNDGIPDEKDKCPNVPEDKDGFEDEDGCPDPDNDRDGIPDRFDHCPNEPETINGIDDEDGCPDAGPGLVRLDHDRVELDEAIRFTPAGKIAPESFNVMGQLGATLRAHAELIKLRIVAHAQAAHAQTVVDWLVQYGIARDRLEAASSHDATAERIEIVVVDRY